MKPTARLICLALFVGINAGYMGDRAGAATYSGKNRQSLDQDTYSRLNTEATNRVRGWSNASKYQGRSLESGGFPNGRSGGSRPER
jgi:hypothetical protein